ncbi:uncharacterized protein PG986_011646 [Apiospora aurea]|uniref:Uncharacterized protein n=1 Tax=Apiospora aurea TaxID=335848 RepID=A0ABR1PXS9_9PEZI
MVLTTESAKARRREISKIAMKECHGQGETAGCIKRTVLPLVIEMFPEPEKYQRPWTNWFREAAEAAQRAPAESLESLKAESDRLEDELYVKQAEIDQLKTEMEKELVVQFGDYSE